MCCWKFKNGRVAAFLRIPSSIRETPHKQITDDALYLNEWLLFHIINIGLEIRKCEDFSIEVIDFLRYFCMVADSPMAPYCSWLLKEHFNESIRSISLYFSARTHSRVYLFSCLVNRIVMLSAIQSNTSLWCCCVVLNCFVVTFQMFPKNDGNRIVYRVVNIWLQVHLTVVAFVSFSIVLFTFWYWLGICCMHFSSPPCFKWTRQFNGILP